MFPSNIWKRLSSHQVQREHQPDKFVPVSSSITYVNDHNKVSDAANLICSSPYSNVINDEINNLTSSPDSARHVSLCVNDLHTTLFIDDDALNNTNAAINNNNNTNDKKGN